MSQNVPTAVITRESTRLWSNQEWALDDLPGVGDIVEYESRFNYFWPKSNDVFVCVHDTSGFGAGFLLQFLCTAPRCAAIESRAAAARQRRDRESR